MWTVLMMDLIKSLHLLANWPTACCTFEGWGYGRKEVWECDIGTPALCPRVVRCHSSVTVILHD